jgi:drug/metabolite transporter (DMT)-like permease
MSTPGPGRVLAGAALTAAAYLVFALHDACVKLLVADLPAVQVLFARSAVILACCVLADRRTPLRALRSPVRGALLGRGLVLLAAWLCYYSAARHLQLAELVTIYYASPLLVAALAGPLLGERVPWRRWAALAVGFSGVLLACRPGDLRQPGAIALDLLAAALWAYAVILIRRLARQEPTLVQMLLAASVFLVACGAALPWLWRTPGSAQLGLLLLVGLLGAGAQFLLYEGIKRAPATVAAPLEFTGLAWSFGLGFLVWGDVPDGAVFAGAGLILASGCLVVAGEWRDPRAG